MTKYCPFNDSYCRKEECMLYDGFCRAVHTERCRNCKYYEFSSCQHPYGLMGVDIFDRENVVMEQDYCSYWERK